MTYSRRIRLAPIWVALALLLAALLLAMTVVPAFAAIDPIVQSQCAARDSNSGSSGSTGVGGETAGNGQHPPGQIPGHSGSDESNTAGVAHSDDNADSGEGSANCENA